MVFSPVWEFSTLYLCYSIFGIYSVYFSIIVKQYAGFSQQLVSELQVIEVLFFTMSAVRLDIEKFDGVINFGLWQIQVMDVMIQSGIHKALKVGDSSKSSMSKEDWEELDLKAASTIRLCLAKNVLANVQGTSTAAELWKRLEELYQGKGISNRLLLKEQFHTLRMDEGTKISDYLSTLNGIVSELEAIGVKIDDEDKALRLILSLPSCYEYIKPVLMYGKETLKFSEVASKLISEERRLKSDSRPSSDSLVVTRDGGRKKKNSMKNVTCWRCGKVGHVKQFCPGGASSAKGSKTDAGTVTIAEEVDDLDLF